MFIYTIDDIVTLIVIAFVVAVTLIFNAKIIYQQWRCKHDGGVYESMACDAICKQCGKNLGFIGSWRKKQEESKNG